MRHISVTPRLTASLAFLSGASSSSRNAPGSPAIRPNPQDPQRFFFIDSSDVDILVPDIGNHRTCPLFVHFIRCREYLQERSATGIKEARGFLLGQAMAPHYIPEKVVMLHPVVPRVTFSSGFYPVFSRIFGLTSQPFS
jgi:hypothetical protein